MEKFQNANICGGVCNRQTGWKMTRNVLEKANLYIEVTLPSSQNETALNNAVAAITIDFLYDRFYLHAKASSLKITYCDVIFSF